jgi:hypothetical protein
MTMLRKLKIELPYVPYIPLLSTYAKEMKSACKRDTSVLMFIVALFIITNICNQNKYQSPDGCIKIWYIYTVHIIQS